MNTMTEMTIFFFKNTKPSQIKSTKRCFSFNILSLDFNHLNDIILDFLLSELHDEANAENNYKIINSFLN